MNLSILCCVLLWEEVSVVSVLSSGESKFQTFIFSSFPVIFKSLIEPAVDVPCNLSGCYSTKLWKIV